MAHELERIYRDFLKKATPQTVFFLLNKDMSAKSKHEKYKFMLRLIDKRTFSSYQRGGFYVCLIWLII